MYDAQRGTDEPRGEDGLAEAFWSVARRLRRASSAAFAPWDVTPSQVRALRVLCRDGEMRPGALAEHLRIAPRSATEVVDGLQGRGLVERTPDPSDRRATLVRLTEEGTRVSTAAQAARAAEAESFFAALSDADRADLQRILQSLAEQVAPGET